MQMNATYTHTNEIIIMSDDDYNHTTIKLLCNMFIDNVLGKLDAVSEIIKLWMQVPTLTFLLYISTRVRCTYMSSLYVNIYNTKTKAVLHKRSDIYYNGSSFHSAISIKYESLDDISTQLLS